MKKILILIFIISFGSKLIAQVSLQERPEDARSGERFTDRLFFGGNLGAQFGSQTLVEIAPLIGYKINDRLNAGVSLKYIYYKINYNNIRYSTNIYGGGPFARFFVLENLFIHTEYELLSLEVQDLYGKLYRKNIASVFAGGGYRQMIGDNAALDLLLLYNLNDNRHSPYENPIIRIGFALGL